MIVIALKLLIFAGMAYWLIAWAANERFFRRARPASVDFAPPVSILKPVKGIDAQAYENFASFCRQAYPEYEILFGVARENDPAAPLVRRLQRAFPDRRIRLVIAPPAAANPKCSTLDELARQARYDVFAISDSDIRVEPDHLRRIVAPLADPQVGLVTCAYRSQADGGLGARWESLHLNTSFLPSAIAASMLTPIRFGLGAAMAVRREDLQACGGYRAIGDYLSDDYVLANRIAGLGRRVVLVPDLVTNVVGPATVLDRWRREVRWARSIRAIDRAQYAGLLITFTVPLALGLVAVSGGSAVSWILLGAALVERWAFGWRMPGPMRQENRLRELVWLPWCDLLAALVWLAGLGGRRVAWRGQDFDLERDNRLRPATSTPPMRRALAALVRRGDAWLRRAEGVREFSQRRDCLLRISLRRCGRHVVLADGTSIRQGQMIGELHFWNEHVPQIPPEGPDLAWAAALARGIRRSLTELARSTREDSQLAEVPAFYGNLPFSSRNELRLVSGCFARLGVEIRDIPPGNFLGRLHAVGEQMLLWALVWTFNPGALDGLRAAKGRRQVWISTRELLRRYGPRPGVPAPISPLLPAAYAAGAADVPCPPKCA